MIHSDLRVVWEDLRFDIRYLSVTLQFFKPFFKKKRSRPPPSNTYIYNFNGLRYYGKILSY
jgi:hypothetical protein